MGANKTVAIIDYAHCGTTMLAGICQLLGVPMVGNDYKEDKLEDQEIIRAFQDEWAFIKLVSQRDAEHRIWGFKYPGAWKFASLLRLLRDPIYFAIFKDPVSVTRRRFGTDNYHLAWKARNTAAGFVNSLDGMSSMSQPVHLLSYERAIAAPEAFVCEVADLIGIEVGDETIVRAAAYIRPNITGPKARYPKLELNDGIATGY